MIITVTLLTKSTKKALQVQLYSIVISHYCKACYYFIGMTGIKTEKISTELKVRGILEILKNIDIIALTMPGYPANGKR